MYSSFVLSSFLLLIILFTVNNLFWVSMFHFLVPSKPPRNFSVTASSSTSIKASWQLPPVKFRNGIITGHKLLYKKKDSASSVTMRIIYNASIHTEDITGLDKYTEYEFQALAFTSVGDGPKSSLHVERTKEDG